jgi:hypothetical protein
LILTCLITLQSATLNHTHFSHPRVTHGTKRRANVSVCSPDEMSAMGEIEACDFG